MKLGELLSTVANLGIAENGPHSRLVRTSTEMEIRAIGLAARQADLKNIVISVTEGTKDYPDSLVYLAATEQTKGLVERRYGNLLKPLGVEPIIRTKRVKKGDNQIIDVIDVPLLDAQVVLACTDLGNMIPRIYLGKPLDAQHGDFNKCGAEMREVFAQFALGRIGLLQEQIRAERSDKLAGRVKNVAEDMVTTVKENVMKKARRVFRPHITAVLLPLGKTSAKF